MWHAVKRAGLRPEISDFCAHSAIKNDLVVVMKEFLGRYYIGGGVCFWDRYPLLNK